MILEGGANIYGIPIGVLSLESYFAKPPGHIKNASTFDFPVTFKVVKGATTKKVVDYGDRSLLEPFIAAARELESEGVEAITGSCGFLALFQREIADAVNIPVFLSSLIQVPMVYGHVLFCLFDTANGQPPGIRYRNPYQHGISGRGKKTVCGNYAPMSRQTSRENRNRCVKIFSV
jgi:hypothetical protein